MQLAELYKQYEIIASSLPNFVKGKKEDVPYDIDIIANGFCDAYDKGDETLKNQYFCAFFIRYWHMILYYANQSPNVSIDTIMEWISDGFLRACKYRSWKKDAKLIGKKKGPEICINNAIDTRRKNFYKFSNAKKRKDNFFENATLQLDSLEDREFEYYTQYEEDAYSLDKDIVEMFLAKKRYLESIIVDLIINGSCISNNFSIIKLRKEANNLDDKYYEYFKNKYNVSDIDTLKKSVGYLTSDRLSACISKLRNCSELKSLRH